MSQPRMNLSILALLLTIVATPLYAERPRIGLVLSGGGALGLAHIGVLEVLEELRVPVDCVSGTSMGALVGGTWAAGVSPQQMRERIVNTDIEQLFEDDPPRSQIPFRVKQDDYAAYFGLTLGFNDFEIQLPPGASAGYRFELFLKELIGAPAVLSVIDFDALPTPFRAIATDLETGHVRVFESGNLSQALRASMSLPALVAPARIDGRPYIDGGLVSNLPIATARELCAEIIIAVNLGTSPIAGDEIRNSLDVVLQSVILLTEQNVQRSLRLLGPQDLLIEPDLTGFNSSSFDQQQAIIQRGVLAARALQPALERFALSPAEYRSWRESRASRVAAPINAGSIAVSPRQSIAPESIMLEIDIDPANLDLPELNRQLVDLYGRGDFEYLGYNYQAQRDQLVIDARPKSWGPDFLKLGASALTDFNSPGQLHLLASYRKTWINRLGAEWRNDLQFGYRSLIRSEFWQPLQLRDGLFVAPYAEVERDFIELYDDTQRLGDIETRTACAGVRFGVSGIEGEFSLAPYLCNSNAESEVAVLDPVLGDGSIRQPGLRFEAIVDRLDSYAFPRSGLILSIGVDSAREQWGAEQPFTRAEVRIGGALSRGEHTIAGKLEWGDQLDGDGSLPPYALFQLGGPRRLAGLYLDQLAGSEYQLAGASYYWQFASLPSQLGRGMYLGASLEAGVIDDLLDNNRKRRSSSASVFWGAETILGVAYIGAGRTNDGQGAVYLSIGPRF